MSDIKFVDRQESINPITQFGEYLYNRLPKVYRDYDVEIERLNVETQKKETFKTLKEYLYSFALGGFQPLLEDLEAIISLVDPFKCPSEFLPYLLRHFGLDYIDDIPEKFQRRLVQNVVTLYKKKGTIPAVAFLAKELSGFGVTIEEKSDGSVEFALIKMNAYEDEDAELLLAQDVVQRYIHLFLPAQTKSKVIVVYGFTENIHINYPDFRINFVADSVDCIDVTMRNAKDLSGMFIYYISGNQGDWSENNVISYSDISSSSDFTTFSIPIDRAEHNFTGNINSIKLVFVNKGNTSDNKVEIKSIKFLDNEPNSHTVFELNADSSLYAGDNTKIAVEDSSLSVTYSGFRGYVYNQLGNTKYDHVYYNVDEYEDITYIDENGYDSKTGGYSEAFDYLKHVVEDDFNALKLKLEEESHNFSPSLPDLTSLTNCVENEGLPMFTNGISCEDIITEQKLTSTTGEVEFNIPASASNISVNKLVGGVDYAVLPIYKCTTDLLKGTTLEFKYDGKSYGYYTLERDLYASENFPTTFQLDIYNNMVKVYSQYFVETIDESYDFTLHSGYGSYYASMKNGFVATGLISDIRIKCDYDKEFTVMNSIYFQPTTTPRIAFYLHNVYISLSNVITSVESATEFVKSYPITIISPCAKDGSGSDRNTSPTGQTISYKKLSDTPVDGSTTIECTVYTMDDRKTVFAYESPVFTQNSNIAISGYYGLKTFPESHVISDSIQVTGHLTGVSLIDYKLYGNSVQNGTPSVDNPVEIQSIGTLVTNTSSKYYGKYDVPVIVHGKNLLSKWYSNTHYSGCTKSKAIYVEPGTYNYHFERVDDTVAKWRYAMSIFDVDGGENDRLTSVYSYLATFTTNGWYCNSYGIVQTNADITYSGSANIVLTVLKPCYIMFMVQAKNSSGTILDAKKYVKNVIFEKGNQYTGYEPYSGEIKHIYLNEPLRKYGDYVDYIDFENQRVVRNLYSCKLNKDMDFKSYSYGGFSGVYVSALPFNGNRQKGICSYIPSYKIGEYYKSGAVWGGVNTGILYLVGILNELGMSTISEFKEWLGSLTTPFEIVFVRPSSIYEHIEVPDLITTDTNTMYMYLGTSIQPSSIDITYYENTPVPQLSEIVYDLGIPLVSFDGYSESIEKIDGKYYLRSAIKEIPLEYMYTHCSTGGGSGSNGHSSVNWFNIKSISFSEKTPFYFNMSPCMSNVKPFNTHTYDKENSKYVPLPNYVDVFDFICFYYSGGSGSNGNYSNTVNVNQLRCLSGYNLEYGGLEPFKHIYNNMFRYSDVPPKFYIYDKHNKYGGETLTEITDKEVINKLNLLPIPEDYAIISSKGIKYSSMDVSVQSKRYY